LVDKKVYISPAKRLGGNEQINKTTNNSSFAEHKANCKYK